MNLPPIILFFEYILCESKEYPFAFPGKQCLVWLINKQIENKLQFRYSYQLKRKGGC